MSKPAEGRGKVILLGEHAVVYGVPALAVGIERGARARVVESGASIQQSSLNVKTWNVEATEDGNEMLSLAFRALLRASRVDGESFVRVEAEADIPPGGGLGCSAAVGVAIARALDPGADNEQIRERVMVWERVFHGNPSGIDGAVSAMGGCMYFVKEKPMEPVSLRVPMLLCVGYTGVSSSTKSMVESVAKQRERKPEAVEKAWEGIRSLVGNARLAIEAGDMTGLGKLLDLNQMLLSGLLVSTEELESLCRLAREEGALGAKLTGAGGGGCAIALAPNEEVQAAILARWERAGFMSFSTRVNPKFSREDLHSRTA